MVQILLLPFELFNIDTKSVLNAFHGAEGSVVANAGLMVTQRNWLEVYPYTNWGGNAVLPVFAEGQRFVPSQLLLAQARCYCCMPLFP